MNTHDSRKNPKLETFPEAIEVDNRSRQSILLTIEEIADILGKKPQTIRNWVAMRKIPFVPGRPAKFLMPSIMKWLEAQEVQPWQ